MTNVLPGDVWQLGRHRLMCGDCLELLSSVPDGSVDMVLCDLPYGVTRNKWDSVLPIEELWVHYHRVCKPAAAMAFTAMQPFSSALVMSNPREFRYEWVWDKSQIIGFLNAKKQPLRRHETVLLFYRRQCTYNPQMTKGKRVRKAINKNFSANYGKQRVNIEPYYSDTYYPTSILDIPQVRVKNGHPTQKPVALFSYLIRTYTNPGETVLDNCAGSGTTLLAAERSGRTCIAIELDPAYCGIIIDRWEEMSGQTAELR